MQDTAVAPAALSVCMMKRFQINLIVIRFLLEKTHFSNDTVRYEIAVDDRDV